MLVLLGILLLCTSTQFLNAQIPVSRLEKRLRSLEQRVANLEAAQRTNKAVLLQYGLRN
jgi:hypothetical protein